MLCVRIFGILEHQSEQQNRGSARVCLVDSGFPLKLCRVRPLSQQSRITCHSKEQA